MTVGKNWQQISKLDKLKIMPAIATDGTSIYVIGGGPSYILGSTDEYKEMLIFNTISQTWSVGPSIPYFVAGATAEYYNGKIYVIGGDRTTTNPTVNIFNISTKTWSQGASLPTGINRHATAIDSVNGYIYLSGGRYLAADGKEYVNTNINRYDIKNNVWTILPTKIPVVRAYWDLELLNGELYFIGGNSGSTTLTDGETLDTSLITGHSNRADKYNISTNTWTRLSDLPFYYDEYTSFIYGGVLYLSGGHTMPVIDGVVQAYYSAENWVYNYITDTWEKADNLPQSTADNRAVVVGDIVYNLGRGPMGDNTSTYLYARKLTAPELTFNFNTTGISYKITGATTQTGTITGNTKTFELPVGSYTFEFTKTGYDKLTIGPIVHASTISRSETMNLSKYKVTSKVVDQWNKPVPSATVSYNGQTTTTDANGNFTVTSTYTTSSLPLTVSKTNYKTYTTNLTNTVDQTVANISLPKQFFTVSGNVKDKDGSIIRNAEVIINNVKSTTDSNGSYTITIPIS